MREIQAELRPEKASYSGNKPVDRTCLSPEPKNSPVLQVENDQNVAPVARKHNKPSPAEGQRACDQWNARWKVGQAVVLRSGEITETLGPAWMIGGHTACVRLTLGGLYTLDSLTPVVKEAA